MRLWQLYVLAALLWLPSVFFAPPTRQQELRVLISARNMLRSGNFHRPEFQQRPRFRKPPMAYWLAAGGMGLTGRHQAAWAGRLLFIAAAFAGIGFLYRIAGPAGTHTVLVALLSFGFWRYAPLAETDMIQLTGILLFFYAWQRQAALPAGLGISFACLSKGPAGFLIPFLCLIVLLRFYRPDKKFILSVLLVPLLLIGAWIGYLMRETAGLDHLQKDLTATFLDTAHRNPWTYYFYTLPLMLLPGGLLVFFQKSNKQKISPIEQRMALAWLAVSLILLMVTVSKQRHYALLLLPPAAWLIGMRIQTLRLPPFRVWLIVTVLVGAATLGVHRQSEDSRNARFLNQARTQAADAGTLHVVGINSAIFDFHLGRHVENTDSLKTAYNRAAPGDAVIALLEEAPPLQGIPPLMLEQDDTWTRVVYIK